MNNVYQPTKKEEEEEKWEKAAEAETQSDWERKISVMERSGNGEGIIPLLCGRPPLYKHG